MKLTRDDTATAVLDMLENTNESFFLTGKAGTGKSTLIKHFINTTDKNVLVVAPTGIAALNVNGNTIHSLFGFGINITRETVKEARGENKRLIQEADIIIIDEISMVRADLMDCVDISICKNTGVYDKPFGGKQMVFVGDMYQLPPVFEYQDDVAKAFNMYYQTKYFFSALTFQHNGGFKRPAIELTKIYRQEDGVFKDLLNKFRDGSTTQVDLDKLNERVGVDEGDNTIHLTTMNWMAEKINKEKLGDIQTNSTIYEAIKFGPPLKSLSQMEETLFVKPGAQIMMLNNTESRKNGTIGTYVEGIDEETCVVKINGREEMVSRHEQEITIPFIEMGSSKIEYKIIGKMIQFPFKLARAISIHKAQGSTFDKMRLDLGTGAFDAGQTYVALSRVKSFEGLSLTRPITLRDVIIDNDIKEFLDNHVI